MKINNYFRVDFYDGLVNSHTTLFLSLASGAKTEPKETKKNRFLTKLVGFLLKMNYTN